jgi:hypothetical protein
MMSKSKRRTFQSSREGEQIHHFVLLRPSADWMMPTNTDESSLLSPLVNYQSLWETSHKHP